MHPRLAFLTRAFLQGLGYMPYGIDTRRSPIRHDVVLRPRSAPSAEFSGWLWK